MRKHSRNIDWAEYFNGSVPSFNLKEFLKLYSAGVVLGLWFIFTFIPWVLCIILGVVTRINWFKKTSRWFDRIGSKIVFP